MEFPSSVFLVGQWQWLGLSVSDVERGCRRREAGVDREHGGLTKTRFQANHGLKVRSWAPVPLNLFMPFVARKVCLAPLNDSRCRTWVCGLLWVLSGSVVSFGCSQILYLSLVFLLHNWNSSQGVNQLGWTSCSLGWGAAKLFGGTSLLWPWCLHL